MRFFSSHSILEFEDLEDGTEVRVGGWVTDSSQRYYREDKKMIRFHFEDLSNSMDCVYFCPEEDRFGKYLQNDSIVFLVGRIKRASEDRLDLRISMVIPIEEAEKTFTSSLSLHLGAEVRGEAFYRQLARVLGQYKGRVPVYSVIEREDDAYLYRLGQELEVTPEPSLLRRLADMIGPDKVELRCVNKSLLGGKRW